jgi:long-subunit acyl-CoA synthetase (AMP-forming)
VKLEDVPDLDYYSTDKPFPRGEICVKTKVMIDGYYKNDAATQSSFTEDGFFRN